jgi:phosphoserine phosphatase RsbU/P
MRLISLEVESKLRERKLWPQSWMAWAALYVLALDLLLLAVQWLTRRASPVVSGSLDVWIILLTVLSMALLAWVGFRWLRAQLLWRLRNRLIVTYVLIGVIPVLLLVMMSVIALYLFAGQFASFVVTSDIASHLRSMEAANRAIAHHLANEISGGAKLDAELLGRTKLKRPEWARRQLCAWYGNQTETYQTETYQNQAYCAAPEGAARLDLPAFLGGTGTGNGSGDFRDIVSDHGQFFLRTATMVPVGPETSASSSSLSSSSFLRMILSEPLDKNFVETTAGDLGRIAVYGTQEPAASAGLAGRAQASGSKPVMGFGGGEARQQSFSAGTVPQSSGVFDHEVTFPIPLPVVDWATGQRLRAGALAEVETRPSVLYARLFAALGDYARGVEYILLLIAVVFAAIWLLAWLAGTKLVKTITSAVDQLYQATTYINRADFSHRITVQSNDQLATLANSFNSMTASIEKLVQEQKDKQRLEGELAIAQEVQAQLYPKLITQLKTLEVHGFCRPARTVSGDYYDFLALNSEKLVMAVGDISGKGISAALLMATIYAAVRAYTIEAIPALQEAATVGATGTLGLMPASDGNGMDGSPANLLSLLNHQLYESTPAAKYATLFLGIYDGATRRLTYANGGHLPPILISDDGSSHLLDCGGTVVGLFDNLSFPEASVQLRRGDILVAYSDGVTEPESDYGEFGEERLIQLVRENRHLPLERITEIVVASVAEWIGDNEQPDDVTLVLARAR